MGTITVGVREAKANLSKLLKLIQNGNEVIVTQRGQPIGKIIPVKREESLQEKITELEKRGILEPLLKTTSSIIPQPIQIPHGLAQRMLREDRENARL